MKELSIEEKAKAYDEAIERAKRMFSEKELNYLFPELSESDDEKIRKEILNYIDKATGCKRWVAWLEKQGEQEEPQVYETKDGEIITYSETDGYKVVEPKFKVGDWVMLDRPVFITKVEDMPYNTHQYWTSDGTWFGDATKAKLWSIQDAKDGDVLVDSLGNVCIYQEPSTKLMYHSYCYGNHKFFIYMGGSHEIVGSYPATKEQHNQLEKAMADAGYVFDFEKKELKKIEQKPSIINFKARDWYVNKVDSKIYNAKFMEESLTNQKRRLEIEKAAMSATGIIEQEEWFIKGAEWSDKNPSYISSENQGEQKSFDYENANIPQKDSTWGEEDKHWVQKVIDFMNHPDLIKATPTLAKDTINWLKSFKDRVGNFDDGYKVGFSAAKHNQWKPSDEQMEVLSIYAHVHDVLASLYHDLKKYMFGNQAMSR